ncbi:MAG TPA: hypothetical protein VKA27_08860, partial [Sunxiuqinia sp.]|nr:hypothetical protein [Sunxiuqinia sp.]
SLMAKTILESLDQKLNIRAANMTPIRKLSPHAVTAMTEIGLVMDETTVYDVRDLQQLNFDYLITLCNGTREDYKKLPLQFAQKLHLGFDDPELFHDHYLTKLDAYRSLRDELKTEIHYFYHRILKKRLLLCNLPDYFC